VLADELTGHVSQGIVELDHNVVDIFDAFLILAAILPEEVRCTANRR
jgi:hypothetical protein